MAKKLTELAEKYRTDKCPKFRHHYTDFYERLLANHRVEKMLELGIGYLDMPHVDNYETGASLKMWSEFFSYRVQIFALDHHPQAVKEANTIPGVSALHVNEDRIDNWFWTLKSLPRDLDFIVDDGSHFHISQFGAAMMLVPLLRPGGIYVIEDISRPETLVESLPYCLQIETFDTDQPDDRLGIIRRC